MEGLILFRCFSTSAAVLFRKQKVSSIYLLQNLMGCGDVARANSSMCSMKMLATTGDTGDPIAVPSVCS